MPSHFKCLGQFFVLSELKPCFIPDPGRAGSWICSDDSVSVFCTEIEKTPFINNALCLAYISEVISGAPVFGMHECISVCSVCDIVVINILRVALDF